MQVDITIDVEFMTTNSQQSVLQIKYNTSYNH